MRHIFHLYHPAVNFAYMAAVLVFTMLTLHPVCIALSFILGSTYSVYLNGFAAYKRTLRYSLVLWVVIAAVNPLFNHNGITILFYLFDNPVTVEVCLYGVASGGMLASILIWFSCYNALVTNEKFLHLFGKALPTVGLMMSMIMRLIPVTRYKLNSVANAQKAMGLGTNMGTRRQRITRGVRISSILMSWTMEDCIETADSMNARGYGSAKRTSFTMFKWNLHDIVSLIVITVLIGAGGYFILGHLSRFMYYPILDGSLLDGISIIGYVVIALLMAYPLLLEIRETLRWK